MLGYKRGLNSWCVSVNYCHNYGHKNNPQTHLKTIMFLIHASVDWLSLCASGYRSARGPFGVFSNDVYHGSQAEGEAPAGRWGKQFSWPGRQTGKSENMQCLFRPRIGILSLVSMFICPE